MRALSNPAAAVAVVAAPVGYRLRRAFAKGVFAVVSKAEAESWLAQFGNPE